MTMARIVIECPRVPGASWILKDDLVVDGEVVARIRERGGRAEVEVAPGEHRLKVSATRIQHSPEVCFDLAPGEVAHFTCVPDHAGRADHRRRVERTMEQGLRAQVGSDNWYVLTRRSSPPAPR